MLRGIDRGLALATWLVAAVLAVMLLAGPKVIAEDKASPGPKEAAAPYATGAAGPDGKALFVSSCGSCHTLSKAGTSGAVRPALDDVGLDAAGVQAVLVSGRGAMPSFKDSLSAAEQAAVAKFVASR